MAATPERGPLAADPPTEPADPAADPMAITETERPVPERPLDPPFALVYDVVRRAARERESGREEMRKRLESTHERYIGLAADAAVALHELRGSLEGEPVPTVLASIARRFATALDRAGVRFDDPVGEAYAAVGRRVDVAHAPDSGDEGAMIVTKTLRPGVLLDDGEVIRRAQVVLGFVPTPARREGATHARGEQSPGGKASGEPGAPDGPEPTIAPDGSTAAEPPDDGPDSAASEPATPQRDSSHGAADSRDAGDRSDASRPSDPSDANDASHEKVASPQSPASDPNDPNDPNDEGGTTR
ncbi:hypothetical protein ACFZBU_10370 [Embleya sp. NPDC008237]|uniref:hypothetical protein n=1 Tax=Embleya sp. NPDC008237 TaxID=3363978 RepID=UPI0036E3871F